LRSERMSAFALLLEYERTYLGHRPKTAFDPGCVKTHLVI